MDVFQFSIAMLIRSPVEVGALIRDKRRRLKLDQSALAKRIGSSRKWIIDVEHGHPRAELGLVLRALDELGFRVDASEKPADLGGLNSAVDINAIMARARKSNFR